MNIPNDGLFRENLSELTPGATWLMATRHSDDGTHRCQCWLSMLVPAIGPDSEIPRPLYCLSELRGETIIHYVATITSHRWTEYGPLPKEIQTLSPDLPDVVEIRREVAGRLHDRFVELVWKGHLRHTRKAVCQ